MDSPSRRDAPLSPAAAARGDVSSAPPAASGGGDGRTVALVDIGTNAARLMLVRILPNHSYSVVSLRREPVRLGEGEFARDQLRPEAIERAVTACRALAEFARANGAEEIVAVATAATREARNRAQLLHRLHDEAGLDVHVVSGYEEARLIYLGVLSRVQLDERRALVIDIGGGSTEVIVGDAKHELFLDSITIGAIRLADELNAVAGTGPVRGADYQALQERARAAVVHTLQAVRQWPIDVVFGTSGTVRALAAVAARALHEREPERDETVSRADIKKAVKLLRSLPEAERGDVPGMSAERAGTIVAGGAILETLMIDLDLDEITALVDCGLREGMLVDYLERTGHGHLVRGLSVRERSVLQLARKVAVDERHARHVQQLAWELFDGLAAVGAHRYGDAERELLGYSALLHDAGTFLSYTEHQLHSYYVIRNAQLLGFTQDEIEIMATTALFHRKGLATARHAGFAGLEPADRARVRMLSVLLRLAERLDHSHAGSVAHVDVRALDAHTVELGIEPAGDSRLELWSMGNRQRAIEKTIGRRFVTALRAPRPAPPARA
jgi:exopolyphosphatase / guanosine-5'-triphosphate,3'-diphosphate pyrophosphatase